MARRLDGTLGDFDRHRSAHASFTDLYLFARLSVFGFTAMLPIAGAMATAPRIAAGALAALLAVAASFHVFAYVLNDVVDLHLDRSEPQRSRDPLVRGKVGVPAALALALAQPPIALWIALRIGADGTALLSLCAAFAAVAAYDLWGKRCAVPPLIDLVQALGWAALASFGAACVGQPGARVAALCGAVVAYVLLVNAVHGGVRDLANDAARGARTTPIYLGARVAHGAVTLPMRLVAYALTLHVALIGAALAVLGRPSGAVSWWIAACLLALVIGACVRLSATAYRERRDPARAESAGVQHLFVAMTLPVVPLIAHAEPAAVAALAVVLALPALAAWAHRNAART